MTAAVLWVLTGCAKAPTAKPASLAEVAGLGAGVSPAALAGRLGPPTVVLAISPAEVHTWCLLETPCALGQTDQVNAVFGEEGLRGLTVVGTSAVARLGDDPLLTTIGRAASVAEQVLPADRRQGDDLRWTWPEPPEPASLALHLDEEGLVQRIDVVWYRQ